MDQVLLFLFSEFSIVLWRPSRRPARRPRPPPANAQTMARKAGHAWNEHDARCIGDALDAAIARRRNVKDVKVEYGAVRFRFDLKDDGEVEVNEEKGGDVEHSGGLPAGDGQASQSAPARPPGLEPSQAPPKKPINPDPSYDDLRKRA